MNIGRHFLKEQQVQERRKFLQTQKTVQTQPIDIQPFKQWLKNRELRVSICWRHRKRLLPDWRTKKFTWSNSFDFAPDYKFYLQKVKKELGEHVDGSRIDAEIALRMRLDGYDINKSINTIYRESEWAVLRTSPEARLEYVKRIAHVSFGTVGTLTIAQRKVEEEMTKSLGVQKSEGFGYSFSSRR